YRTVAAFLASSFNRILERETAEEAGRARRRAVQARDRAGEAFDQFLNERGARRLAPETGAFLVASGTHAIMVGDLVNVVAEMGYRAGGCSAGATALQDQMQVLLDAFRRLADRLGGAPSPAEPRERVSD